MWPCAAEVTEENVKKGLFTLECQPGHSHASSAAICRFSGGRKTLFEVSVTLQDAECIVFDDTCAETTIRNITITGVPLEACCAKPVTGFGWLLLVQD